VAVDPHRDGGADLTAQLEIALERVAHSDIAGCA
jgi:hypothetical protein